MRMDANVAFREVSSLRLKFQMNNRLRLESLAALSRVFREYDETISDELLASMVFAVPDELHTNGWLTADRDPYSPAGPKNVPPPDPKNIPPSGPKNVPPSGIPPAGPKNVPPSGIPPSGPKKVPPSGIPPAGPKNIPPSGIPPAGPKNIPPSGPKNVPPAVPKKKSSG